jgi:tetratricopeptide (TPR) repeat protein
MTSRFWRKKKTNETGHTDIYPHLQHVVSTEAPTEDDQGEKCVQQAPEADLQSEIKKIQDEIRAFKATFHRSFRLREALDGFRARLERLSLDPHDEPQQCLKHHSLAMLHEDLGNYDEAEGCYRAAVPYMYTHPDLVESANGVAQFYSRFQAMFRSHHLTVMIDWFSFSIESRRNLDEIEDILRALPWLATTVQGVFPTDTERQQFLVLTIQIFNAQHNYAEAFRNYQIYQAMFWNSSDHAINSTIEREKALLHANQSTPENGRATYHTFALALTMVSISEGVWHHKSLKVLYLFGKQLRVWGHLEVARVILQECCLGAYYQFGWSHPVSSTARSELKRCDGADNNLRALFHFRGLYHSQQASTAYEHMYLDTVADLLWKVSDIDWDHLENLLNHLYITRTGRFRDVCRTLARCKEKRGDFQGAYDLLAAAAANLTVLRVAMPMRIDKIRIMSQDKGTDDASGEAKLLITDIGKYSPSDHMAGQLEAVRRKLTALGVMHFAPNQPSADLALVVEQNTEILGTGTYAVVDSVKVGHELYARKSVALPRFRQQQIREAIQSELSVIRTLNHPHIIQVYFTYEDKSRFYIIMEPLADCDLEAFLMQYGPTPPTESQQIMVWKWLRCLSNTLAFVHSKGIRHKDIKPRNILVKGGDVIFADFGSSHAFLDGGDSTTEGPSYGHTKMYCAPEVIEQTKRNRSADIFSLGCVFTELAVWLAGWKDFQPHKWHEYRKGDTNAVTIPPYHASLGTISQWFYACNNELMLKLYAIVLHRMLREDPGKRLNAAEVGNHLIELLHDASFPLAVESCSACRLGLWIDVSTDGTSSVDS